MSLYVRLNCNFYTHRKTARLRSLIGDDAFWLPPRLWSYAAENCPDGCFKDFTASELAMLLGYTKDASSMLEALLQAGFMDSNPLRIHDWADFNGYHTVFAARARAAANARWEKQRESSKEKVQYKRGEEPSIATSMQQACFKHNPPILKGGNGVGSASPKPASVGKRSPADLISLENELKRNNEKISQVRKNALQTAHGVKYTEDEATYLKDLKARNFEIETALGYVMPGGKTGG